VAQSDTVIAFPTANKVSVGSGEDVKEYTVQTFKMGKTLVVLERLAKLLEEDAITQLMNGVDARVVLVKELPKLVMSARQKLFELFALILTPSRELIRKNEDGTLDEHLTKFGKELEYNAETQDAFSILEAGIDAMGIEIISKNVGSLIQRFGTLTAKPVPAETN